jgi:hypothetical protein
MSKESMRKGVRMVAPQPPADGKLHPVEELAKQAGVSAGTVAGLSRAKGWAPGKCVTAAEFEAALGSFQNRPMGSGSI